MNSLAALRERIDQIDAQVVDLLNQRAACVLEVKRAKAEGNIDIYSPERERQILDRVTALAKDGNFPANALERIFGSIISATRSLIGELGVSYSGGECSIAHEASVTQFGETVRYTSEVSIEEVFAKVERGDAHYGVVPARLSSSGTVTKTFDLLSQSNLCVIAEIELHEHIALLGASSLAQPGERASNLTSIERVYGDMFASTRAGEWLRAHLPQAQIQVVESPARAAAMVASDPRAVMLGLERAAERFHLSILARGVQSETGIDSRFFVIGTKMPAVTGRDKTSLLCAVEERAGALRDILRPFAERGVTLVRIESRPLRTRAWEYVFLIDLEGHVADVPVKEAIDELSTICSFVRTLGSYPMVSRW